MNDPMTSVEIEDVLSSIRRLVSEDLRPVPAKAGAVPAKAGAGLGAARPVSVPPLASVVASVAPEAGKLLLTPALRVVSAPDPVEAAPEAPFIALTGDEAAPMGAVVARIGAQVSDDWDSEPDLHAARSDSPIWEPEVVEVDLDAVEEAEVLEVTSAEDARLEDAWRDGAWAEDRPAAEAELVAPEAENAPDSLPPAALPDRQLEAELADLVEAEILARIEADTAEAEAETQTTPGIFAPGDADDFDEEALRDVVRDIIREELQGALGERITRNVRKLVRAEINRALASQSLS